MKALVGLVQIIVSIAACIALLPVAPVISCLLGATLFLEIGVAIGEVTQRNEDEREQ